MFMVCFTDKDIVDMIFTHPRLSKLALLMHNSDFLPLLRKSDENVTVFAPTNSAFLNVSGMIDLNNNDTEMFQILSRHKITGHGALTIDRIIRKFGTKGVNMTIDNFGSGYITLYKLEDGNITALEEKGFNKSRTIIERDIHASNGVIHVLDGFL